MPRMLCAGSDRTDSIARRCEIDDRQPAAEGVGDDQPGAAGDAGHLARAERQVEAARDRQRGPASSGARGARLTNVNRRGQVEATTADSAVRR